MRQTAFGTPTDRLGLAVIGDAITPIDAGEIYQRGIPQSHLAVVENCGHMPEMETPAEFAGLVRDFLAV